MHVGDEEKTVHEVRAYIHGAGGATFRLSCRSLVALKSV